MEDQGTDCCENELWVGVILIVIGSVLLMHKLDILDLRDLLALWPLALIGLGVHQLLERTERRPK